jgi:hypothetical protein
MRERVLAIASAIPAHPEYLTPNELGWNVVLVFWGMLVLILGASITAYIQ